MVQLMKKKISQGRILLWDACVLKPVGVIYMHLIWLDMLTGSLVCSTWTLQQIQISPLALSELQSLTLGLEGGDDWPSGITPC